MIKQCTQQNQAEETALRLDYKGRDHYVDNAAVRDGNLITAGSTGDANVFFAMMQAIH